MAVVPSQKCLREESSEHAAMLEDDVVHDEKHEYTKVLKEVEAHNKDPLYVVCTRNPKKADEMIQKMRMKIGGMVDKIIGIDVDPDWLDGFLKDKMYTFVGFDIARDKVMLSNSGLEINPEKFIDMQKKWRHPYTDKSYDSLADVASKVIHPFYKHMKQKLNRNEDHKLWGIAPLLDYLIQYVAIDAYATYNAWATIDIVINGLYMLNYDEKFGTTCDY
ncbi:hypothetical protein ZWY2020_011090 [Hordeum vulgare]|nr:hypothetical protein ZWY2020_011090 [Hordeum vulgare]